MGKIIILLVFISLYGLMKPSSSCMLKAGLPNFQDTVRVRQIPIEHTGALVSVNSIGSCTIFEKDKSIIKQVNIREVRAFWIVYEKENSLHDILIENISRIVINNSDMAIYFDEENKPVIRKVITR